MFDKIQYKWQIKTKAFCNIWFKSILKDRGSIEYKFFVFSHTSIYSFEIIKPNLKTFLNNIQLLPALNCSSEGCCFPEGFRPRKNNIPRVNNYDVHRKCRQKLFYYTETLFTIMLDAIKTYLCVFILCFHKLHICVFNFRSRL